MNNLVKFSALSVCWKWSKFDSTVLLALDISCWCRLTNYHSIHHFSIPITSICKGVRLIGTVVGVMVWLARYLPAVVDLDEFAWGWELRRSRSWLGTLRSRSNDQIADTEWFLRISCRWICTLFVVPSAWMRSWLVHLDSWHRSIALGSVLAEVWWIDLAN